MSLLWFHPEASCVPDVKEDFVPPLAGMPGQFPVYLRLPYRRDSYFCFKQQSKQDHFLSALSDCIRHQNHGEWTHFPTPSQFLTQFWIGSRLFRLRFRLPVMDSVSKLILDSVLDSVLT